MAFTEELVGIDTPVVYNGSIESYHGYVMVVNAVHTDGYVFEDGTGGTRYTLRYGLRLTEVLQNVRRQSFKPLVNG